MSCTPAAAKPSTSRSPLHVQRGSAALDLISYDWQAELPGWTIHFKAGIADFSGLTFLADRRIEIFVRVGHSVRDVAEVLAHELGHAADVELLDDTDRDRWLLARGKPATYPWFPATSYESDFDTGAGDFAEAFAMWQIGAFSRTTFGTQPTTAQLALIPQLIGG